MQSTSSQATELNTTFNITDASTSKLDTTFKMPPSVTPVLSNNHFNKDSKPKAASSKSQDSSNKSRIRKSSENRSPEHKELAQAGIMKKKRKIGAAPSSFFPNLN